MGGSYSAPAPVATSAAFADLCASLPQMSGKTVAVTGCTTGTGLVLARVCAERGARVLMLNRASTRAQTALQELSAIPGAGQVSFVECDLSSFASVRQAAATVKQELGDGGLDVLCNNAGVMAMPDAATTDGCCVQMQTNHLSHFLLTAELWPLLETAAAAAGEARVVNHSSQPTRPENKPLMAEYLGKNGGNLGGDAAGWMPFTGPRWQRYQQTKLANIVFTLALRDKLQPAGGKIKALVAHPGLAATNLQVTTTTAGGMSDFMAKTFMASTAQSAEDGAMGIIRCCCEPAAAVESGAFYGPEGMSGPAVPMPEEPLADGAAREMLWTTSMAVTGAHFPFDGAKNA
jgi:NAD(P)-dependent dehydrogenase (short-subunit alcohol dehydrogenase family)